MNLRPLVASIGVTLGLASAVYAVVCAAADPVKPACQANDRVGTPKAEDVANEKELVDTLNKLRAAAKARYDAATAARDTALQRLAQGSAALDGGVEGGTSDVMTTATLNLAQSLRDWSAAEARWACEAKQYDSLSVAADRGRLYQWALEPAVSVAGGAGGDNRYGGGLLLSIRDGERAFELQAGAGLYRLSPPSPLSGGRPTPAVGPTSALQIPIRTYFGNSDVALYLGVSPTFLGLASGNPTTVAIVPQGGLRLRGMTDSRPLWFGDVKLFAEPWFFFDGSVTTVMFGAELGFGAGPQVGPVKRVEWTYHSPTSAE